MTHTSKTKTVATEISGHWKYDTVVKTTESASTPFPIKSTLLYKTPATQKPDNPNPPHLEGIFNNLKEVEDYLAHARKAV